MKVPSSMSEHVLYMLLLTTLLLSAPAATSSTAGLTMRAELTHVDKGRGFTRSELMTRMLARTRARVARLHQRGGGGGGGGRGSYGAHPTTVSAAPGDLEYLIHFAIGGPRPQLVALNLDTGSDLVWTQCNCGSCFDQSLPVFETSASSTMRPVGCGDPICGARYGYGVSACSMQSYRCFYLNTYGDSSVTAGFMLRDTFTFKAADGKGAPVAVPGLAFGCGQFNNGLFSPTESGIAGFGRGPQSLPSQLKVGMFSHCFTNVFEEKSSPVFLGVPDDLRAHSTGPIRSTPIIHNPFIPDHYYLSLEGITVGKTRLPLDKSVFAINNRDGSGGTIIDSGTSYTSFPDNVLQLIRREFVAQMPLPVYKNASEVGNNLCFISRNKAAVTVPKLIFHLAAADMDLPPENYLPEPDDTDDTGLMCLQIFTGPVGSLSIIGNFQQQNMHIVYDTDNNKLLFVPAQCDKL